MRISMNRSPSPVFRLSDELEHTFGSSIFKNQNVTKITFLLTL
jgi:hypothetical protein